MGQSLAGATVIRTFDEMTLIVAIKSSCDGCRDFVHAPLDELKNVSVIVLSATPDLHNEWIEAAQPVLIAPEFLAALHVDAPPFYVLVDPVAKRVVSEGVVFSPAQVAAEIAPYLS